MAAGKSRSPDCLDLLGNLYRFKVVAMSEYGCFRKAADVFNPEAKFNAFLAGHVGAGLCSDMS